MTMAMSPPASQRDSQSSIERPPGSWRSIRHSQEEETSRIMENTESQGSELLTQNELMTQNELTQLGDTDEEVLSPLPPQSPLNPLNVPWGRLIPCSRHEGEQSGGIDLLPSAPSDEEEAGGGGVSFLGLENLKSSDVFNVYMLGRSHKCDIIASKPPQEDGIGKDAAALQDWAHAMISNRHCRIYCMLKTAKHAGAATDMAVYIEDTSGNGTLINNTTLLRRGEKRMLHTGDEICLVNPTTLRKKIRSNEMLSDLQRHHSFIFVNVFQQQGQNSILASIRQRQSSMRPPSSVKQRRGVVDVRAMNSHSIVGPQPRVPAAASRRLSPRRKPQRRVEEEYDIRDVLGSGTCGEVRRAIHRRTGEQWAVKVIPLGGRNRANAFNEASAAFEAEASILQALDHPYVVKLVDVFVSPGQAVYLVMELLHGGDLFDRIVQKGKYTEDESRRVMRRLLNAMFYLHEIKMTVHRDLKPENILCSTMDNDICVKLTDFGLAKTVTEDGLKTFCGTPQYFAPEVLRRRHTITGRGRYGKEADCWSLGVILYILLSGTPPFDASLGLDSVVDAKIAFPPEKWLGVSDEAKDLVRKLLMADPAKRISVKDSCNHIWFMMDDGDTHTHPLDDPAVTLSLENGGQSLLSNRRLFSQDESNTERPTTAVDDRKVSVRDERKHDSSQTTEDEGTFERDVAAPANAETPSCTGTESLAAEVGETSKVASDGTIHASNVAKSSSSSQAKNVKPGLATVASMESAEETTLKQQAVGAPSILLPSLTIASSNVSESDRANGHPASTVNDATQTMCDTPADGSSVHAPVSLNARSNNFRDLVVKSVDASNATTISKVDPFNRLRKQSEAAGTAEASQKISPEEKRSPKRNLVTPKTVDATKVVPNRLSTEQVSLAQPVVERKTAKPRKKKASSRKVKLDSVESRAAELSEDEICSQFSDEGDSISSFGTSTEGDENDAKDEESKSKRPSADSEAPPQKRKKRRIVFGQLARKEDGIEVSDEDVAANVFSKFKTKPAEAKAKATTKKSKSSKESKTEATGGRQTTLSNWFTKTS